MQGVRAEIIALTLNSSVNRLAVKGLMVGTHGCTKDLFIILTLEEEVRVFKAKLQK